MVAPRTLAILSGLLATLLLSGCSASNGPGGQSARADGSLAYNGSATGSDSDDFECDGTGSIHIGANLGSGKISVRLRDGAGTTAYQQTVESPGQDAESSPVSGAAGQWTLTVTRSTSAGLYNPYPSFSGQYGVHVDC